MVRCGIVSAMKRTQQQGIYPSLVVGSVSGWDAWKQAISDETTPHACDVLELRADTLPEDVEAAEILALPRPLPILLTVRHAEEGGAREMSEEARQQLAASLLPMAAAIDWEIAHLAGAQDLLAQAHQQGVIVVASAHDFNQTPRLDTLCALADQAIAMGADVVKFAFRVHSMEDVMVGVSLLKKYTHPMAVMGMGPLGATSRLIYNQYGSVLTYGYLGQTPTAPGQWSAALCKAAISQLLPAEPALTAQNGAATAR